MCASPARMNLLTRLVPSSLALAFMQCLLLFLCQGGLPITASIFPPFHPNTLVAGPFHLNTFSCCVPNTCVIEFEHFPTLLSPITACSRVVQQCAPAAKAFSVYATVSVDTIVKWSMKLCVAGAAVRTATLLIFRPASSCAPQT